MNQERYDRMVELLEELLSENELEILNDALQSYGRHADEHAYDAEIEDIRAMAAAFDRHGHNTTLPEYDILTN